MSVSSILLLNGPNLDMLGVREPDVYGSETLADLELLAMRHGESRNVRVTCRQSNSEAELIELVHAAPASYDGIVYNPGAHTHYSYALRDAIGSIETPVVEVHITDIDSREEFRRVSVIAPVCVAQVKGLGFQGYCKAIDILCDDAPFMRLGEGFSPVEGMAVALGGRIAQDEAPSRRNGSVNCDLAAFADSVASEDAAAASERRCKAVQEESARQGVQALLVRDTSNVRWITALDDVFDAERAHALLVFGDTLQLHTDSRYSNAIRQAAVQAGCKVQVSDERQSHAKFAHDVLEKQGATNETFAQLGFEDTITYAEYCGMQKAFAAERLRATSNLVVGLRAVKDAGELTRMRAAQAITDAAFAHITGFMRPGMTEREVQLELEDYMVRHGAEGLAFSSIVATGANGADPHAIPGDTRLEAGQCVVMDFGAKAFGYCADMTRMVFLGEPTGVMREAWDTLRRANEEVEAFIRPGVTGAQAHRLAEKVLEEGGFGGKMGHGLGHGVGLDVHEQPVLNSRNDEPLVEGNVVTVEPGIYLPGEFGMRLEDCGVVTDSGYEPFTQTSHELFVI